MTVFRAGPQMQPGLWEAPFCFSPAPSMEGHRGKRTLQSQQKLPRQLLLDFPSALDPVNPQVRCDSDFSACEEGALPFLSNQRGAWDIQILGQEAV